VALAFARTAPEGPLHALHSGGRATTSPGWSRGRRRSRPCSPWPWP